MSDGWETADSGWETANDGWETAGEEPTALKGVLDVASSMPFALAKQFQGAKQAAGEFLGQDQWATDAIAARKQIEAEEKKVGVKFESDVANAAYGGVKSTLQAVPAIGAAAINPLLGMGMIAGGTGADAYGKYRARGGTKEEAALGGALEGGIEGATEALPLGFILKRLGKDGFINFVKGLAVREGFGEQVATIGQDAVDTAIANPNKTWTDYLKERPGAALDTAIATGVQVGLMGGASAAGRRLAPTQTSVSDDVKSNLDALDKAKEEQKRTQGEGTLYVGKDGDVTNELPRKIEESPEQLEAARTELQRQLQEKATRNVEGQQLEILDEAGNVIERPQELDLQPQATQAEAPISPASSKPDSPEFKEWFGKSTLTDVDGEPQVYYHGSDQDFESFRPNKKGLIFVSKSSNFVDSFPTKNISGEGKNTYPVYVRLEKPFKYYNREARIEVLDKIFSNPNLPTFQSGGRLIRYIPDVGNSNWAGTKQEINLKMERGDWFTLERPEVIKAIKDSGHDGMFVKEGGGDQIAVFDPNQLKSVYNRGTWSRDTPEISASNNSYMGAIPISGPDLTPNTVRPWNEFLEGLKTEANLRKAGGLPALDEARIRKMERYIRSQAFDDNAQPIALPESLIIPESGGQVDVKAMVSHIVNLEQVGPSARADLIALMKDIGPYIENVKIQLADTPKVSFEGGREVPAYYTSMDHRIVSGRDGFDVRTMMHELVHAATVRAIIAHVDSAGNPRKGAPQFITELNKIYNDIKAKAVPLKRVDSDKVDYYLNGGRIYGLENLREFASEVMTNRYLQKMMSEMKGPASPKPLLKRFFEAVSKMLGISNKGSETMLTRSMSLIGDIMEYQKNSAADVERLMGRFKGSENLRSLISEMGTNPDHPNATQSVKISTPEAAKAAQIEKVSGETYIPKNPEIDDNLIAKIAKEPDGSKTWNLTPGANARAELANSTLVKTVYQLMNNAYKRGEYNITKMVKPAQDTFISILRNPQKAIVSHDILMREMKKGNDYTAEELRGAGVSDDIIKAHLEFRAMMQDALEKQNRVLRDKGLPEVTALESYVSSRWSGPWRVNIKDSEGNVVWQVAEHSKKKAMDAVEWIKQKEPNLVYDEPKYRKGFERGDNVEAGYLDMLKVLDKDDPRVATLESIYKDYLLNNTENVSSQEKHFLKKKGVRGFAGDRAWSDTDIRDFFEQQFAYAENAYRWSEAQKSMEDVKKLINNKDLQESQKNNIQFSKEYIKNQLGFGKSEAFEAIDNGAARLLGTSPQELQKYMGAAKTLFYLSKLGLSLPFTVTQFLQPAITTPGWHSKLSTEGIKHNPIQTTFKSLYGGAQAALWHYGTFFNSPELTKAAEKTMSKLDIEAAKYMEANGVVDINPMTDIKKGLRPAAVNAVAAPFEFTIKHSEVVARSMAFMGFVDHLKQSGKYDLKSADGRLELFQKAEDMTNLSMTDYRTQERALVFEKMGLTGDAAATLHSYQINNLMQLLKFGQEAANGNPRPLFMMVAMQAMAAGLTGLWFIDDLDDLINNLKKLLPHDQYMKVKDFSLKNLMVQNLPDIASYGLVSAITGTNIHTRMNASDQIPMWPFESTEDPVKNVAGVFPFIQDTINTGMGLATAASPSSSPKERMAGLYAAAPTVAKGPMENLPQFERNGVSLNPKNLQEGQIRRTEEEKSLRNYGLRSIREQKQKDSEFALSKVERQLQDRVKSQSTKAMDYITSGDPKSAVEHLIKYDQLGGDPQAFINRIPQAKIAEVTTELQRRALQAQAGTKSSILKYQRYLQQVQ